ncbi:hypothetical protein [uncultured Shimia sp.]|uniref:hypothetical protein n=1 Tax=uncultured Shimia sp. TaxID=573152 RepID=UPI002601CDCB|nr:hypothetical protein [uncultured Shimia sp.]
MMRLTQLVIVALALAWPGGSLLAETVPPPRDIGCIEIKDLEPDYTARELAGAVRSCVEAERHGAAVGLFLAYNSTAMFDQQRVRDETAHVVVQELNGWIFSGYSRAQIDALKHYVTLFRSGEGDYFETVCKGLRDADPPDYRPSYMIVRGQMPRKHAEDWAVEGFDPQEAWNVAVSGINGCPAF